MMHQFFRIGLLSVLLIGGTILSFWATEETVHSQPSVGAVKFRDSLSAVHCIGCHGGTNTPAYEEYAKREWGGTNAKVTDFVLLNEHATWAKEDMHSQAFKRINPKDHPIAARMQDNLRRTTRGESYEVSKAQECLVCHAVDLAPKSVLKEKRPEQFLTTYGVSCEACHGAANDWIGPHVQETWRELSPKAKAEKGLIDLRDPAKRTELCTSCHVGNLQEGKFVSHEMYAAGHPPLPTFELVTFSKEQPAHYHKSPNAALEQLDAKLAKDRYHYRTEKEESNDARALATGSVGTMKAFADLVASAAAQTPEHAVADFALFDCYACHHELRVPGYRQNRGYRGVPGRPTLPAWPGESTRVLLSALDGSGKTSPINQDFTKAMKSLQDAADAKPFGDPKLMAEAAKTLVKSCNELQAELDQLTFDTERSEKLYQTWLAFVKNTKTDQPTGPEGLYLDYFAAQQAGWSINVLQESLRSRTTGKLSVPSKDIASTRRAALGKTVQLELRPVGSVNTLPSEPLFNARMEQLGKFDPVPFLKAMIDFGQPGMK